MDGPAVILVALVTSALTAGGTVYMVERYNVLGAPAADAIAPDLRGMTENEARSAAASARLSLFVASHEPTADARPGTILRQSVGAGHHLPPEAAITVVLADEIAKVPNVVNVPLADAVQRLEAAGYSVQIGSAIADPKVPEGVIMRQVPKADLVYAKPGIVAVQASAGPGDVELPKLLGTGVTAAKTKLEDLGLKAVVRWVAMAETPTNVVLNQSPAAGQRVKPGSEVALTVCTP